RPKPHRCARRFGGVESVSGAASEFGHGTARKRERGRPVAGSAWKTGRMELEIGRSKRARRVYSFDDIAVVPNRRTRDPQDVSVSWTIDAYKFDIPVLAAPMDSVVSPATAIQIGQLGG